MEGNEDASDGACPGCWWRCLLNSRKPCLRCGAVHLPGAKIEDSGLHPVTLALICPPGRIMRTATFGLTGWGICAATVQWQISIWTALLLGVAALALLAFWAVRVLLLIVILLYHQAPPQVARGSYGWIPVPIGLMLVVNASHTDLPLHWAFRASLPALRTLVTSRARGGNSLPPEGVRAGLFKLYEFERRRGVVQFVISSGASGLTEFDSIGFAYSPHGAPANYDEGSCFNMCDKNTYSAFEGSWYLWRRHRSYDW